MASSSPIHDPLLPPPGQRRIVVVGTTGSGKSTLADELARRLRLPHIEMDALHWLPGWQGRPDEELRQAIDEATSQDEWVLDGNYSRVRDIVWPRARLLVWLDYPLAVIFWRLFWRTLRRSLSEELLWGTNRESLFSQFFSRESLFLWALQSQPRRRRDYPALLGQPEYAHLRVVRHRWPGQTRRWLDGLDSHG